MRPSHLARLDTSRPVVVLTRDAVRSFRDRVTVAPITSTVRCLTVEVPVGARNGVDHASAINCDDVQTVPVDRLGRLVGYSFDDQEDLLTEAVTAAFDLA